MTVVYFQWRMPAEIQVVLSFLSATAETILLILTETIPVLVRWLKMLTLWTALSKVIKF
ncbi:hypothetical protein D3C72_2408560 [compost metagenome]